MPLVLDADGLAALAEQPMPRRLVALLHAAHRDVRPVLLPTVVCAEVCRGATRTTAVAAALSRHGPRGRVATVRLVDTSWGLAKQVGAILHAAGARSQDLVDAHVVALCVPYGGGVVATSDPTDVRRLAEAVPDTRIVVRPAR